MGSILGCLTCTPNDSAVRFDRALAPVPRNVPDDVRSAFVYANQVRLYQGSSLVEILSYGLETTCEQMGVRIDPVVHEPRTWFSSVVYCMGQYNHTVGTWPGRRRFVLRKVGRGVAPEDRARGYQVYLRIDVLGDGRTIEEAMNEEGMVKQSSGIALRPSHFVLPPIVSDGHVVSNDEGAETSDPDEDFFRTVYVY